MSTYKEERFKVDVNIFVERKKRNFHFALDKILTSYYFFNKLILFVKSEWEKSFFSIAKNGLPRINCLIKIEN